MRRPPESRDTPARAVRDDLHRPPNLSDHREVAQGRHERVAPRVHGHLSPLIERTEELCS